ncbi:MAG: hypothetical protein IPK91_05955 [Saprospiraceae bacterium]|nr:hypothetical protein [Saprospiraceae bacterium]MBK8296814.1 hypothetical protein [Saprospiraceae bacterium]
MSLIVLCLFAKVLSVNGQSNAYYIQKADNFVKNFHAQLNNIHNNAFSVINLENEAIAIVLDEMIKDRDMTLLYDNVAKSYITNNYVSAQKYMDIYQAYFNDRLNKFNGVYSVQCTFGDFKEDTVYNDTSGLNKVCRISRVVNIHYINEKEKKLHRSDTISFFVLFEKGNPNTRLIIGSVKYIPLPPTPVVLDTDGDGIPNQRDSCVLLPGSVNCFGCPDTDLDGICDKEDQCIDKSGPMECSGCPDTDGDGICDLEDLCPIDSGSVKNYGCPDIVNKPTLIEIGSYPKLQIPFSFDIEQIVNAPSHEYELELKSGYKYDLSEFYLDDFKGDETFKIAIKVISNRKSNNILIETDLIGITLSNGKYVLLTSISNDIYIKSDKLITMKKLYDIDLNSQELLITELKNAYK